MFSVQDGTAAKLSSSAEDRMPSWARKVLKQTSDSALNTLEVFDESEGEVSSEEEGYESSRNNTPSPRVNSPSSPHPAASANLQSDGQPNEQNGVTLKTDSENTEPTKTEAADDNDDKTNKKTEEEQSSKLIHSISDTSSSESAGSGCTSATYCVSQHALTGTESSVTVTESDSCQTLVGDDDSDEDSAQDGDVQPLSSGTSVKGSASGTFSQKGGFTRAAKSKSTIRMVQGASSMQQSEEKSARSQVKVRARF
jgi:hypothetical protein